MRALTAASPRSMKIRYTLALAALLAALLTPTVRAQALLAPPVINLDCPPDVQVNDSVRGQFKGDDITSPRPVRRQTIFRLTPGPPANNYYKIQNDTPLNATNPSYALFRVKAAGRNSRFGVRYRSDQGGNVTALASRGRLLLNVVASRSSLLQQRVVPARKSRVTAGRFPVTAANIGNRLQRDVAQAIVVKSSRRR